MKRIGKMLAVILGGGLLVVVGAMFGPRTAHAIVSTLVQVVNTGSQPVLTGDVTGLSAYADSCLVEIGSTETLSCTFQAVPAGKRLIIQEADASFLLSPSGTRPVYLSLAGTIVTTNTFFGGVHFFPVTFLGTSSGFDDFTMHQETRLYVDQNQTPSCSLGVNAYPTSPPVDLLQCDFSGYLVNLP